MAATCCAPAGKAGALERCGHRTVKGPRATAMLVVVERALHGERDIVVGRQIGEHAGDLERVGDAEAHAKMGRHPGNVPAVESDHAR